MKVLLTGCTAPQTSQRVSEKFPTFQSLLFNTLHIAGHEVVWDHPSVRWTEEYLSTFDSVVVGLSSPTSISSHRLYGALSVVERAKQVTNVKYLLDSPEPHKIRYGIKAIVDNPENLVKDFYSKRYEFTTVVSDEKLLETLQSTISNLYNQDWEKTLVPSFPWFDYEHITKYIPNLTDKTIIPLCMDSILLTALSSTSASGLYMKSDSTFWSYDSLTPWVRGVEKTIKNEIKPMVDNKLSGNSQVLANINKSIGSLISTYKNNTPWWNVNLSQSLFINTPVITDWRHTGYLGDEWSILAHQLEELSLSERSKLAMAQRQSYIKEIPKFDDVISVVSSSVFM